MTYGVGPIPLRYRCTTHNRKNNSGELTDMYPFTLTTDLTLSLRERIQRITFKL